MKLNNLEVCNMRYDRLCTLIDNSGVRAYNVKETHAMNEITELTFDFPVEEVSGKYKYLSPENLIICNDEYYRIKTPELRHDEDGSKYIEITARHLSETLQYSVLSLTEQTPKTAKQLMMFALGYDSKGNKTVDWSGWSIGKITAGFDENGKEIKRGLEAVEDSMFSILVSIAEKFEAMLVFHSQDKTVDLLKIDKSAPPLFDLAISKDLKNVTVNFDTSEMITRMYCFGGTDDNGVEINIKSVNPTKQGYIENYDYFLQLGYTMDEIKAHPELFTKTSIWRDDNYYDAQTLYEDGIKTLANAAVPTVNITIQGLDLTQFGSYRTTDLHVGDTIRVKDDTLDYLDTECIVTSISVDYEQPYILDIEVTNIIQYKDMIQSLFSSVSTSNSIISVGGKVKGSAVEHLKSKQIDDLIVSILNADEIKSKFITTDQLKAQSIRTDELIADKIQATEANIQYLRADTVEARKVMAEDIYSNTVTTKKLVADTAVINNLVAKNIDAININTQNLKAANADITNLKAETANINELKADKADITELNAQIANIESLYAKTADIEELYAKSADVEKLYAKSADVTELLTQYATVNNLDAYKADVDNLYAKKADIDTLVADSISTYNIDAMQADIQSLQADKANVTDLTAVQGDIDTLESNYADIQTVVAGKVDASEVTAIKGDISTLQTNYASISTTVADKANIDLSNVKTGYTETALVKDLKASTAVYGSALAQIFEAGTIDATNITVRNLTAENIVAKSLNGTVIADDAITKEKLKNAAVTLDKLASGSVSTDKIVDNAVTDAKIGSISAGHITFGEMEGARIKAGTLDVDRLSVAAIEAINDEVQVGGRNLAKHTNQTDIDGWHWMLKAGSASKVALLNDSIFPDGKSYPDGTNYPSNANTYFVRFTRNSTANSGYSVIYYDNLCLDRLLPMQTYTISFDILVDIDSVIQIALQNTSGGNNIEKSGTGKYKSSTQPKTPNTARANKWTKIIKTFTLVDTITSRDQVIYITGMPSGTGKVVGIRNLKFEAGTKATQWTAAPEDDDEKLTASINLSKDGIISTVTKAVRGQGETDDELQIQDALKSRYYTQAQIDQKDNSITLSVKTVSDDVGTLRSNAYKDSYYVFRTSASNTNALAGGNTYSNGKFYPSENTFPTSEVTSDKAWTRFQPDPVAGHYLWSKLIYITSDNKQHESDPVLWSQASSAYNTAVNRYSMLKVDQDSITASVRDLNDSVNTRLTASSLTTTISSGLASGNSIKNTKFTLDKNGIYVANGGLTLENGSLTIKNTSKGQVMTMDSTGKVVFKKVTTENISTDAIKSLNYQENTQGSFLNLADGTFKSKNFKVGTDGSVTIYNGGFSMYDGNGVLALNADDGDLTITGILKSSKVISGYIQSTEYTQNSKGIKIGLNGNGYIDSPNFKLTSSGNVTINGDATFSGDITGSSFVGGSIQSSRYTQDTEGLRIDLTKGTFNSKQFSIDESGNASFTGTISGNTFSGCSFIGGSIQSEDYKVVNNVTQGMKINLKNGVIDSKNFSINEYGNVSMRGNLTLIGDDQTIVVQNDDYGNVGQIYYKQVPSGYTWAPGIMTLYANGMMYIMVGNPGDTKSAGQIVAGGKIVGTFGSSNEFSAQKDYAWFTLGDTATGVDYETWTNTRGGYESRVMCWQYPEIKNGWGRWGYPMVGNDYHTYTIAHNVKGDMRLHLYVDVTSIFDTASDYRLKKDIRPPENDYIQAVGNVDLYQFEMNRELFDPDEQWFGLVAQDLVKEFEKANLDPLSTRMLYQFEEKDETYYAIDYPQFLTARTIYNEQRIEQLENEVKNLKKQLGQKA